MLTKFFSRRIQTILIIYLFAAPFLFLHTTLFFTERLLLYSDASTTEKKRRQTRYHKMYATRAAKPKLSLSISAAQSASARPSLSLRSPGPSVMQRTPLSPSPISPVASRWEYPSPPTYAYTNSSTAKSILKKHKHTAATSKRIHFESSPTVYCVTPIENKDEYYGQYAKMSRDERRWGLRS